MLSSTQQNLIASRVLPPDHSRINQQKGMFGNLGMYGTGIPTGIMVDRWGPRAGAIFGCATTAIGYMAIYKGAVEISATAFVGC